MKFILCHRDLFYKTIMMEEERQHFEHLSWTQTRLDMHGTVSTRFFYKKLRVFDT